MILDDRTDPPTGALTLAGVRREARRRMTAATWDFVAGGAGDERTLAENTAAFDRLRLRPRFLTGAGLPSTRTRILGRTWDAPIGVAPLAYQTLIHPDGEVATARAAATSGLGMVVSAFAGRLLETISAQAGLPLWLQLYCFRDRDATRALIERAERAGVEALVLTVDTPRPGRRIRDIRNGFRLPAEVCAVNFRPADPLRSAEFEPSDFEPAAGWDYVEWLRTVSPLPVLLKGILSAADARIAVEAGVEGLIVSNHGGRQFDGAPATLDALPEVAAAVHGRVPILLDGGVRRGSDVLAALALGASAVLLGRPVLHGLAAAGQQGVERVFDIVAGELAEAMALTGTASADAVDPDLVIAGPTAGTSNPPANPPAAVPRPARAPRPASTSDLSTSDLPTSDLTKSELHRSLSDPVLDTMTFLNEVTHRYPEAISFAPGRPYDGFFDTEQIFDHIRRYIRHLEEQGYTPDRVKDALFQYGPTAGRIRELIADSLRLDEGIDVPPESVVVTVGCQEAMLLVLRALVSGPDDVVLVSSPCYVGVTGAARLLDAEVVAVPERPDGFHCDDFEAAVRAERARGRQPRALYVIPDHSNPLGTTMPPATRRRLLDLAARLGVLVIEDSPYRLVSPGPQLPTLKSLDRRRGVVHLGSFSKSLFPGARVGFAVADQTVADEAAGTTGLLADELVKLKSMVTVNTSALSQAVVAGMLLSGGGGAADLNKDTAEYYGQAMRTTLRELDRAFPAEHREALGVRWNQPEGGFFLAVSVPFRADNAALARSAQDFGVIWTPMSYFHPDGGGTHELRLSVSYLTEAEIAEGVARFAAFVAAAALPLQNRHS